MKSVPRQDLRHLDGVERPVGLGHRAYERLVRQPHMRTRPSPDAVCSPAGRQARTTRAARTGAPAEASCRRASRNCAEILDRAVAPALVEVVDEGRAVVRREHRGLATADLDAALGVAGDLGVLGRHGRDQPAGEAAGEAESARPDVAPAPLSSSRARGDSRGTRCRSSSSVSALCSMICIASSKSTSVSGRLRVMNGTATPEKRWARAARRARARAVPRDLRGLPLPPPSPFSQGISGHDGLSQKDTGEAAARPRPRPAAVSLCSSSDVEAACGGQQARACTAPARVANGRFTPFAQF